MNKTLKTIAYIEYGASPKEIRTEETTPIPIYGTGGVQGYAIKPLFKGPLVVVARKGTLDNPIFVQDDCWIIDTAFAVLPHEGVDAKWLYFALSNYDLKRLNESTGVPSISRDYLYRLVFEKPSLPEQRKIALILSTIDNVIEKTEAAIAKYEAIKQGAMQDLFTRGIDIATGKLRPEYRNAPELYKYTELGWIPKEWDVINIGDSCTNFINGGTPSTKNLRYWSGTIPWVTGADFLESFEIGTIRRFITEDAVCNSPTHVIKGGNILLVTRTGVGKLAVAPFDIAISQDITGLILDPEIFDIQFFYYYLQVLVENFKKLNQGTSINGIVRKDLENTLVVKPKIEEQIKIAPMISAIDSKLTTEFQTLNKIQKLRLGLMESLLTGNVRITYEDDESLKEAENATT
jgi:type I restriction enzyme S subunit